MKNIANDEWEPRFDELDAFMASIDYSELDRLMADAEKAHDELFKTMEDQ
jgi:hypothetical protein